ncbi:MAG: ABC transporter six-transmembrane domain-containing protein [Gemmatimonadota bacterium]
MTASQPSEIGRVLVEYRLRLLCTYGLFAVEMLGTLTRPYFLGLAVDGLLAGTYRGLIWLTAVHLVWLVIGTVRHMYDTRTFSAIYTRFVTRVVSRGGDSRDVSRLSAHSGLARQVVDFLAYDVNYIVEALYNLIGSLVILTIYDRTVAVICLAVLGPALILSWWYGRATLRLNVQKHDQLEQEVGIIARGDRDEVAAHYRALRGWQIRLSDQEAWNFGATEILVLLAITGSLLITVRSGHPLLQVGGIIVIYNYILRFASGLETIPYAIERLGSLKDILRRTARLGI